MEAARACLREEGFNALSTRKVAERCASRTGAERRWGLEPSVASSGAGDGNRTHDNLLGKQGLYR